MPREKSQALANKDQISVGKELLTWFKAVLHAEGEGKAKNGITEESTKKEKMHSSVFNMESSGAVKTLKKDNISEDVSLRLDTTVADVRGVKPIKLGEFEGEDSDNSDH